MSPDTIGTTIISPTYRFSLSYWPPTMTSSIRTLSRYGLMIPRKLVTRIAASTTPTWSRYGPKNATIRRTVRARRSGGTRSKSLLGGVRRPGPPLPLARARTPPPRKLIDPNLAPIQIRPAPAPVPASARPVPAPGGTRRPGRPRNPSPPRWHAAPDGAFVRHEGRDGSRQATPFALLRTT